MNKILLIIACVFFSFSAHAGLKDEVKEFKLKNGMRWLVVEKHNAPVFAGAIAVRVGGSDESPDLTGLAHMFEHMAFKGGKLLPKPEQVSQVISKNGSPYLNAFTSKDMTMYYASLPSNRLKLWGGVFADMVGRPAFNEFYTERSVVEQERRSNYDGQPDGRLIEKAMNLAFKSGPYKWMTIGHLEHIRKYTKKNARSFYKEYYKADNMVGVVVGDVNFKDVKKIANRYFSFIPKGGKRNVLRNIPNSGEEIVKDRAKPVAIVMYHKPTLPNPTEYSFDVITNLMCTGRTSRLIKKFVYDKRMASSIECSDSYPGSRLNNLFLIWAEPLPGVDPMKLANKISKEIESLGSKKIKKSEIVRVTKQIRLNYLKNMDTNLNIAEMLAQFEVVFDDWELVADYPGKIKKVTPDDIKNVSRKYLVPQNRAIIVREEEL